ncbi:MAG: DUF1624 domain-containing protein [Butyrivibrio sp.]|uniref:heparan-alpha-glucosaminide N-acetyltransferase domain-containing protein n=1 Tax=Butyrivibrio sp. TaxID=28121 RepID=UPI0025ED0C19|nr:heparan-alpha-glucosaminide N-acetyltransferase domain-containing protein [Butyrivibrio sp.]MCR5773407.1 DUF1624 domain-containing protein [Butyrivibrio sp.]
MGKRLHTIDSIRGLTLISMMLYHLCWDLVYIAGIRLDFYTSTPGYIWQQSICWSFILISGFCVAISNHPINRGLIVFLCGLIITIVTSIFLPEDIVIFGVLTLHGSAMIITGLLLPLLEQIHPALFLTLSAFLFTITRHISEGYIGFPHANVITLSRSLYANYFTTYLGFPFKSFYSTDYFAIIPWIFLFWCGFALCRLLKIPKKGTLLLKRPFYIRIPGISFIGKHSLIIYMLHQPVLYALVMLFVPGAVN